MAPRTKPAEDRRRELLDAGQRAFVARGIAATTVDDITAAAGVAKGTFYLYFSSKEHLLGALRERFTNQFSERLERTIDGMPAGDWPARLDAWVAGFIRGYLDQAELHDILFQVADLPSAVDTGLPVAPADNTSARVLEALLREGLARGVAVVDDAALASTLIYSALHGAVHHALHFSAGRDTDRLVAAAQRLVRRSLMPWSPEGAPP
jgi:AcrR family transcriptional regulator